MMMRLVFLVLTSLYWVAAPAAAHTFFVGSSEIIANEHTKSVEVIHRFTSHDLEALLSDRHQVRVLADSEEYLALVEQYVARNFSLVDKDGNKLPVTFVGVEAGINDTYIYQEVLGTTKLEGVTIHYRLLTDYFPNQKNRVNFESKKIKGSLLFDNNTHSALMK